ncbi:hypothetical protein AB0B95_33380, partial [Streptomyces hygroscopicus]|uniref:hypothetical protein n=1 Tax=Streptomyces hygroscopicus TaxID=1912 RepID=UPI0033EB5F6F
MTRTPRELAHVTGTHRDATGGEACALSARTLPSCRGDPADRHGRGPGRADDGLALVQHGGRADQQRCVDDVGVADHPADVG